MAGGPDQSRGAPKVAEEMKGHVILTNYDPITMNLVDKLRHYQYEYVIVMEDVKKALEFMDLDYNVVVGELSDPETYRNLKAEKADPWWSPILTT
jgi:voltage-gated potassium channel